MVSAHHGAHPPAGDVQSRDQSSSAEDVQTREQRAIW